MDRLATLYFCYPTKRVLGGGCRAGLPILMYHGVRKQLDARPAYYETTTSPKVFTDHLQFLREQGYQSISLSDAVQELPNNNSSDKKVVITFDDGYRDFYTHAFPALAKHGFTATLFLPTGYIADKRVCLSGNEYLTWEEVRELHTRGIAIGSHTVSHRILQKLPGPELDWELGESKRTIEDKLGAAIRSFSFPYAFPENDRCFSNLLETLLANHGYECGVSTIIGRASTRSRRHFLPRLPVNVWDDRRLLKAKLEGGYDWLHVPQRFHKAIKRKGSKVPTELAGLHDSAVLSNTNRRG